ncbi:hypothetical protein GE21DRAFT_1347379 [Neurospora crassa]|nr:hypothetical protein GE21DRAFT_1347379 [Neurospora crassa]
MYRATTTKLSCTHDKAAQLQLAAEIQQYALCTTVAAADNDAQSEMNLFNKESYSRYQQVDNRRPAHINTELNTGTTTTRRMERDYL